MNIKSCMSVVFVLLMAGLSPSAFGQDQAGFDEKLSSYLSCCPTPVNDVFMQRGLASISGNDEHEKELRRLIAAASSEKTELLTAVISSFSGPADLRASLLSYHQSYIEYIEYSGNPLRSGPSYHNERARLLSVANSKMQIVEALRPIAEFKNAE